MGFPGDEDGEALRADGGEVEPGFHAEGAGGFADFVLDVRFVEAGGGPGGLEGHAEAAAGDLFLEGLDVGAELEEKLGDAGDDAGFVGADEGEGSDVLGHGVNKIKR